MRCFKVAASRSSPSPRARPPGAAAAHQPRPCSAAPSDDGESGDGDGLSPRSSRSAATSQASPGTFNLLAREYTLAVQTQSYTEIWSKIHTLSASSVANGSRDLEAGESAAARSSSAHLVDEVLWPDRGSVDEALRSARPGRLRRLVSDYFDSSEHTSRLCIHLHRCVERAHAIYGPLIDLLDILPTPAATAATTPVSPNLMAPSARSQQNQPQVHRLHPQHLSQSQCERAFDVLQEFSAHGNPFPAPGSAEDDGAGFEEIRRGFVELRRQLDRRLRRARARARLLSRTTSGSALCLIFVAVGITVSGLVLAVHALPALAAAPLLGAIRLQPADPLAARRRQLKEHVTQLDAAARGTYVLNNSVDTIQRLVARLHATVESDRELVSLGLSRSRGDYHPIEQVVRQLRRSRQGLLEQLHDLEEHVCLCFAAINRARCLLLRHIHCHPTHYRGRAADTE